MEISTLTYPTGLGRTTRSPWLRLQSDDQLIKLTRAGNDAAFEILVGRYDVRLLAFCRHLLRSREDAEDVLQEAFSAAYNAIHADERYINARPWLYRIARNRCLNHLRRAQAVGVDSMDVLLASHGETTADKVQVREEFRMLVDDIHGLPETQRTALILREMDALSYDQIAEAMETTVSSVKSLLVRARVSLAEAAEARLLSCAEVRDELGEVAEGLMKRPSAPVRRHLRTCERCAAFHKQLRRTNRALGALLPIGPVALWKAGAFSHLVGHAGGGAATGGGMAGGGTGGAAVAGSGAAAAGGAAASSGLAGAGAGSAISASGFLTAGAGALATKAAASLAAAAVIAAAGVSTEHARHAAADALTRADAITATSSPSPALDWTTPSGRAAAATGASRRPARDATAGIGANSPIALASGARLAGAVPSAPAAAGPASAPASPGSVASAPADSTLTSTTATVTTAVSSTTSSPDSSPAAASPPDDSGMTLAAGSVAGAIGSAISGGAQSTQQAATTIAGLAGSTLPDTEASGAPAGVSSTATGVLAAATGVLGTLNSPVGDIGTSTTSTAGTDSTSTSTAGTDATSTSTPATDTTSTSTSPAATPSSQTSAPASSDGGTAASTPAAP